MSAAWQADLVPQRELGRLTALLRALNPEAHVTVTKESRVAPREVVGTGRFSMERAARAAGWLKVSRVCQKASRWHHPAMQLDGHGSSWKH